MSIERTLEEEARRAEQQAENERIANAVAVEDGHLQEFMTIEDMLERCIYIEKGQRVAILPAEEGGRRRIRVLTREEFAAAFISSGTMDGNTWRSSSSAWNRDPSRITVHSTAFGIGRPRYCNDHEHQTAVNLWNPVVRKKPDWDWKKMAEPFFEHVAFLAPILKERERFLDWLAHIEQKPAKLPHHGYLMYTRMQGIGRNWLASVLTRIWGSEVAPSINLPMLLASSFNGTISGKRLAVVDEVRLGGGRAMYAVAEALKKMMTEETRSINPKFEREYTEWNVMRWLMFSNHEDAIPMTREDRRFAVIANPETPRDPKDYERLYDMLDDPKFIASVAWALAARDISKFKPGARPEHNAAKESVHRATTSEFECDLVETIQKWSSPIAATADLMAACDIEPDDIPKHTGHFNRIMRNEGHQLLPFGRVRLGSETRTSVWVLAGKPGVDPEAWTELRKAAEEVRRYRAEPWFRGGF